MESGDVAAGDDDGGISIFSVSNEGEYYISKEFKAHSDVGGVASLVLINEHTVVSGGDRDGKVIAWDATRDFDKLAEAKLTGDCSKLKLSI